MAKDGNLSQWFKLVMNFLGFAARLSPLKRGACWTSA